jgi:integrase/recombinase XerD
MMMKQGEQQTIQKIASEVEAYFTSLSYNKQRIRFCQKGWALMELFMIENSFELYDAEVGEAFINKIKGTRLFSELDRTDKDLIRCANVLTEYQNTGSIKFRSILKKYPLNGEIEGAINSYLTYRKSEGASDDTITNKKLYLHRLLEFLEKNQVKDFSGLNNQHILTFINSLGYYSKSTIHCMLSSLRSFLKYLFDIGILEYNLTYLVPKSSYKKEARLPTTYTKDEVNNLLASVDRGNPKGKRDFTMILLAARLGLRASDICGLKFENIHWETNTIRLVQKKTKENIELPILTEIGNAIIDYLKYGRPKSDHPYLFLRTGQPYDKLEEPTLHSIVSFYLKQAGIKNIENKKHGPHALRHSLAGILLEKKTPLPVISEVLGHTNTESTKTYLRIDLDTLRQCALDVLPLNTPLFKEVN